MLEYLNFFLLCAIFASILYLYIRIKKYFPILKMAEELIGNIGYGAPQSDTKRQKLLECVLSRNSKLYLGKVYTEEQLAKLSEEEVEKLFNNYKAKLSGQMVKSLGCSIINPIQAGLFWNHIGWGGHIVPPLCFSSICYPITTKLGMLVLWHKISQKQ